MLFLKVKGVYNHIIMLFQLHIITHKYHNGFALHNNYYSNQLRTLLFFNLLLRSLPLSSIFLVHSCHSSSMLSRGGWNSKHFLLMNFMIFGSSLPVGLPLIHPLELHLTLVSWSNRTWARATAKDVLFLAFIIIGKSLCDGNRLSSSSYKSN